MSVPRCCCTDRRVERWQAQKADFHFSLDVAGKGQVEGVLYYFPFQNERETLPTEDFNLVHNPISHYNMTQQPGVPGPSQVSTSQAGHIRPTQLPLRGTPGFPCSSGLLGSCLMKIFQRLSKLAAQS